MYEKPEIVHAELVIHQDNLQTPAQRTSALETAADEARKKVEANIEAHGLVSTGRFQLIVGYREWVE